MKPTPNSFTPGALRESVTIEKRSTSQDSVGEQVHTWTTFAERRAELMKTPGAEVWSAQQRNARVPTTFRLRYLSGVEPGMRIIWSSKLHDIKSAVDPTGRKEQLIITAEELVGEAP